MDARMKTLFWLYKSRINKKGQAPIILRVTINSKKDELNTGLYAEPSKWDSSKERVRGNSPTTQETNNSLDIIRAKSIKIFNTLLEKEIPPTAEGVISRMSGEQEDTLTLLKAFHYQNELLRQGVGHTSTKATVTKYKTLESKVSQFIQHQYQMKDLQLKELNHEFVVSFEIYLKTQEGISHTPL
ncbi:phage integrase SAM-like domain and Arm DNA-binding domain-containing protein [Chitinophaga sedimenti]|uniref:phage integrase SAM-like domain-containing protein n=1 Tax=Chitinophaga sedimenti TaxID=2033606 RepID=UPI0020032DF7|nr:phage integrase SAM-like domain-containing protein [Chitinophaga sedimenti]MCK7559083.1 phage integrase SAM-like domain and Arm DNA-binding domain-containing protein [Chitinophaga sedimenti]